MAARLGRTGILVVAVAVSAAVIAVTVLFANVTSLGRVIDHADELHHVNATLGTAALARAAAGQAALFDQLADRGLADPEEVAVAHEELDETVAALGELSDSAHSDLGLDPLVAALTAQPLEIERVEEEYWPAAERLRGDIARLEREIGASEELGGYISGAIRLLVVLIIPAAALLIYRRRVAEQVREERVRMEAQLEAEREIARAKDRFVAGMSHEIRTPLTGICGFTEVLLDSPPEQPVDRETLTVIHSEASELSRMVDDFIVTSRIDGNSLEVETREIDLLQAARPVVDRFERAGASVDLEGETSRALCDPGRVRQVLTNLVSNAVRHGGPQVRVSVEGDGSEVRCRVSDDGPGVASDVEERLFSRFIYDGTEALTTGSLGLGTWVARELAREMDGDVTYRRDGDWTVFTLVLPAVPASPVDEGSRVEVGAST